MPYLVARITIYCTILRAMINVQANYSGKLFPTIIVFTVMTYTFVIDDMKLPATILK